MPVADLVCVSSTERFITLPSKEVFTKSYEFEIDGHIDKYLREEDVRQFFLKPIYREDVLQAMQYIKGEIRMRQIVYKNNRAKRDQKVKEMELPLRILYRCSDRFPELQKEMFG
jgi:hypothetical protein